MESVWAHESPCEKFLRQLRRERAIMFMKNREYMKGLRHDNERALQDQKAFGKIWKEYGTNVTRTRRNAVALRKKRLQ